MTNKKQIKVLKPREHLLKRPSMYIGPVVPAEEKILTVNSDGKIEQVTCEISVGMYRLFDEILDNAIDEFKRCQATGHHAGPITVSVESKTNTVSISDRGHGFYQPDAINEVSGISNIESALSLFMAGSNFDSDDEEESIVGTNGIGSAAVNMLSDYFSVHTVNDEIVYEQEWNDFVTDGGKVQKRPKTTKTGTTITFRPMKSVFKSLKYERDILFSKIALRQFSINHGLPLNDKNYLQFKFTYNGKDVPIDTSSIFHDPNLQVDGKKATFVMWETYDASASLSMVNGSLCTGIHQKIVQDWIAQYFKYPNAHHFYDFFVSLDIPPRLMRFGDQNKTKFVGARHEIEPLLERELKSKILKALKSSPLSSSIAQKIEQRQREQELKTIKATRKKVSSKISDKYFGASGTKKRIFLTEGRSAAGSINQFRSPENDSVYALRGKIKNTKTLSDLSSNLEIAELMNVLNLDISKSDSIPSYDSVIIATDADADGAHIGALIINFFHRWFPTMIKEGRLMRIETPICSVEQKKQKTYFYSTEDAARYAEQNKTTTDSFEYYKGLGSYSPEDWEYIFGNMRLQRIHPDAQAAKFLDIAFGNESTKRKVWLELGNKS